ncbi:unnamed protein product [Polarella glacialis]|uniref:Uncharacterized protein n=1 Tax=Polarella glacialis TaxID=89957 RepID=A0A813HHZ1_POLGL|nr:unnamed protein product [Polarella glacialis]
MTLLTGDPSWRMWLGELGCSSPLSPSLISAVKGCQELSGIDEHNKNNNNNACQAFYRGFLDWDLSIGLATDLLTSPEHVFWFTMRDALGHQGIPEFFGLMSGDCSDQNCKLKAASQSTFPVVPRSKVPADSYETGKSDKLVPGHLFARQGSHETSSQNREQQPQQQQLQVWAPRTSTLIIFIVTVPQVMAVFVFLIICGCPTWLEERVHQRAKLVSNQRAWQTRFPTHPLYQALPIKVHQEARLASDQRA